MVALEERVRAIHQSAVIVDAHLDLGMYICRQRKAGRTRVLETDYWEDMKAGGVNVIVAAIFVEDDSGETPLRQAMEQIAAIYAEQRESPDIFSVCRSFQEIEAALAAGKLAILLSFEGVEPLGKNPELLPLFYQLGVRGLGLAWSRRNFACDGGMYTETPYNQGAGLTDLGVAFVREAQRLGMFLDISHLNDAGVADVFALAGGPVLASHSDCRAVNPTKRNLSDEQIREVANRGGVIGLNSVSAIVSDQIGGATMETLLRHLDHMVRLAGIDHVGLGFDFALKLMPNSFIEVNGKKQEVFDIVKGYQDLPALTRALLLRGYDEVQIRKLYGENFMRLYRRMLP